MPITGYDEAAAKITLRRPLASVSADRVGLVPSGRGDRGGDWVGGAVTWDAAFKHPVPGR